MAPTQRHRWLTLPDSRTRRRSAELLRFALDRARADFEQRHPTAGFGPVVALLAAYDDHPAALAYLLVAGANPCLGDRNGNTALMGALYKGELAIARRLLKTRCPIDQMNNAGETALSFAALFGRLEILPELVALQVERTLGLFDRYPDGGGFMPNGRPLFGQPLAALTLGWATRVYRKAVA